MQIFVTLCSRNRKKRTFTAQNSETIMADNYLEKQYEQYEARKAAWEKQKKHGKKKASPLSKPNDTIHHPETKEENS